MCPSAWFEFQIDNMFLWDVLLYFSILFDEDAEKLATRAKACRRCYEPLPHVLE
jgi:hypothetical protein